MSRGNDPLVKLADLVREQPALPRAAHERAIQAALTAADTMSDDRAAQTASVRARPKRSPLRTIAFGGVAMAAAAAIVVMMLSRRGANQYAEARDAAPGTTLRVGRAQITVSGQAPARIAERQSKGEAGGIMLSQGEVEVDLPPDSGHPFRIETKHFAVVATGGQVDVTQDGVRVHRGAVRVESLQRVILAASVEAGQAWSMQGGVVELQLPATKPEPASEASANDTAAADDTAAAADDTTAADAKPSPAPAPRPNPAHELATARRELAARNIDGARAAIHRALDAKPRRSQRAEAETLLAECAMVAGDAADALARYQAVATRFHGTPAAENALFAAARLAARDGKRALARQLLDQYSQSYPDGRFAHEVDTWRRRLGTP